MITCVIIDDEKPARDALELMLARYFPEKIKVLATAGSLKEGVYAIYQQNPDLVFLDIEMPEENGFRIFNYFQKVTFAVIFITAYKEYAIKAIKVAALDYILKPVNVNDLKEAVDLYEKRLGSVVPAESIGKLLNSLNYSTPVTDKIALPTFDGFRFEKAGKIMYCKADQNYTVVYIKDGAEIMVSKSISVVQQLLPADLFYRIHKSYLVNLNYIKNYNRTGGYHVILENGTRLDVAGRRHDDFLKALTRR